MTTQTSIVDTTDRPRSKVLTLLGYGQHNAITGRELAFRLGESNDRQIRLAIRALIADGVPVASSVHSPMGFFIAETRQETEGYIRNLQSRIREDALRLRDYKRSARNLITPEQLNLL